MGQLDSLAAEAELLLENGQLDRAASLFERLLCDSPSDLRALRGLAEACFSLGDISGAKHYTGLALQIDPNDARTLNNAGVLLFHERDYERSTQFLQKSISVAPDFVDAHINICASLGRLTMAEQNQALDSELLMHSLRWISGNLPDPARDCLVEQNRKLRESLLTHYRNIHYERQLRVLLYAPTPLMGALYYIFESWNQCLNYMGIESQMMLAGFALDETLELFDPNIFLTVDVPEVSGSVEWGAIYERMNRHRMLIGLCSDFRGHPLEADFYVTFHLDPKQDEILKEIKSPLLSIPFAFNPLLHRMSPARTLFEFAFVGTNSPLKQVETLEYLIPIVRNHTGILAGTGWPGRFGNLSQGDAGILYNFAAICPNYHLRDQIENFSEVNERTHVLQACGAFQLCDSPRAIRALYAEDELVSANTSEEFQKLFKYYLEKPTERETIVARGMTKAWASSSYFTALQPLVDHASANL